MSVGSYSITDFGAVRDGEKSSGKAFGLGVIEETMAQSEAGRSPAERGVGVVVLIILTL